MNKRSAIADDPIPEFPLPYPTGYKPAALHDAWTRALVIIEHVGIQSPNPMARLATISRIARAIADYDRLDAAERELRAKVAATDGAVA